MPRRLRAIADGGADAFYNGPIAARIVAAVRSHPTNAGSLTLDDLPPTRSRSGRRSARPIAAFRSAAWDRPPPARSTIGQILGMVEPFDIATLGPDDPESWRIIGDATRLAFADRERYIADSDFVTMPKGLLDRGLSQGAFRH